eukprot:TRINITY_DN10019_c0_g2_i1.p2 TRINITY_DN10019_c0_g2~~TRINITY_DN10019_c0_g2_i1.p2  ORF type:complete len:277 (+),score=153.91 TRINITY_DN10019_c0_g2_i1:247-1077(+)
MGASVDKSAIKSPGTILMFVGLVLNIVGAILVWQEKGLGDSVDYLAACGGPLLPLFLLASVLVPALQPLAWFGVGLGLFLLEYYTSFADSVGNGGGSSQDDVLAGLSLLIIGSALSLLGLLPVERAGGIVAGAKAALAEVPGIVIVVGAVCTFIGAALCWAYADKTGASSYAGSGVLAIAHTFLVCAAAFGGGGPNSAVGGAALVFCAYGFLTYMLLALGAGGSDKSLGEAGGVFLWIGVTLYMLALAVLPGVLGGGATKVGAAEPHGKKAAAQPK